MKTGVIVYVRGEEPKAYPVDDANLADGLDLAADRVEIASTRFGHFDVHDAWWALTAKGMQLILCAMAEYTPYGKLKLTGPMMRLCG
jgi:hypothetical protein